MRISDWSSDVCSSDLAGLRSARAQGRSGGRQPTLSPQQQAEVITMLTAGRSTADIARLFRVHRATISRIVSNVAVKDTVPIPERSTIVLLVVRFSTYSATAQADRTSVV